MSVNNHKNHSRKHKKHKVLRSLLALIVLVAICFGLSRLSFVQNRLEQTTGDTAAYQKREYQKQRALAKAKYGNQKSSSQASAKKKAKYVYYTVEPGDYLSTIAQNYGVTVAEIQELNDIDDNGVQTGQK